MTARFRHALLALVWVVIPTAAYAQASVAGTVRDVSASVLPGVTVEAASPALIEKVRSVVSDGSGQYRIVDLRPGVYTVTFTLPGFSTFVREGIELTGSFTATVDAELRVGTVEETITVTGQAPIVDVQSSTQQRVLDRAVLDSVPTGRTAATLGVLIPGVVTATTAGALAQDIGGNAGSLVLGLRTHGGRQTDQVYLRGGTLVTAGASTGYVSRTQINLIAQQELVMDTSGGGAELATGGVRVNIVPREGGNTFRGGLFLSYGNDKLQGSNFTQELKDRGLRTPDSIKRNYDFNPGVGGPIMRDRLWFFFSSRINASASYAAESFANANANNPNLWTRVADQSQRGFNEVDSKGAELRMTWQATARNKLGLTFSEQYNCECPQGVSGTTSPEAATRGDQSPQRLIVVDYTAPISSRLLLEAGVSRTRGVSNTHPAEGLNPLMISVLEQSNSLRYRAAAQYRDNYNMAWHTRSAVSYVTGTHAYKTGFNFDWGKNPTNPFALQPLEYRLNNGVPNRLTMRALNFNTTEFIFGGAFGQDVWTRDRLTLRYGARFDMFTAHYPEQLLGPTPFTPTRNIPLPAQSSVVSLKDVSPRFGVSYDLFGTGRTAVKGSVGRYLEQMATAGLASGPNPATSVATSTTRNWTDTDGDFVPDCDLLNPARNLECREMANPNFGNAIPVDTYDRDLTHGWGRRNYNWEFSLGVQQELRRGVAMEVSYFRRWFGNFSVTDDRALGPNDFDTFSITAPVDPRLPDGGGYVVSGNYDVKPGKFGIPADNLVTRAQKYGEQYENWQGVDVTFNARPGAGVLLQGGFSTGRTVYDTCEVAAKVPESLIGTKIFDVTNGTIRQPLAFCHVETPYLTQVKLLGSYIIPKVDVQISGTFQDLPGEALYAEYVATNAVIAPSLGRNLEGGAANQTINVLHPGTAYGDRLHQLDFRVGKIFRFGRTRTSINIDIFNALNTDAILSTNRTFGTSWLRPNSILLARFAKINAQIDF